MQFISLLWTRGPDNEISKAMMSTDPRRHNDVHLPLSLSLSASAPRLSPRRDPHIKITARNLRTKYTLSENPIRLDRVDLVFQIVQWAAPHDTTGIKKQTLPIKRKETRLLDVSSGQLRLKRQITRRKQSGPSNQISASKRTRPINALEGTSTPSWRRSVWCSTNKRTALKNASLDNVIALQNVHRIIFVKPVSKYQGLRRHKSTSKHRYANQL